MSNSNINFVKFLRGTEQQYNNLLQSVKGTDKNTLYFIYDKNSTEEHPTGKLYLDKFLIGGNSDDLRNLSLSDLTDTNIGTLTGDEVLKFDNVSEKWKPVLLSDVLSQAGLDTKVTRGIVKGSGETSLEALLRATNNNSAPGDIGEFTDGTVYVSDAKNSWFELINGTVRRANITQINDNITNIQSALNNVYTKTQADSKIAEAISTANHLSYTIVSNIGSIDVTSDSSKNKVFLVPKTQATNDGYNEYMVIGQKLEKIGDWGVDLTHYVTDTSDRLLTNEQKTILDNLALDGSGQVVISGIVNASNVQGLDEAIQTKQFIKSVDTNAFNVTQAGKLELTNIPAELLTDYVTTTVFNNRVGNLNNLINRVSENSTLVDEINEIKISVIWQEMSE